MYLNKICELAGGYSNLKRITLDDTHLYLTLEDLSQLNENSDLFELKELHDEHVVVVDRNFEITQEELFEVGKSIDAKLRLKTEPYQTPTICEYRPSWHIAPPQGLLNDPNGFIYHNGEYILFYQWYPYGCKHSDKYWVQLRSDDLVNWKWVDVALTPSDYFDSHGVYSGHAITHEGDLYAFYTGNTRIGEERLRQTTQCIAKMNEDGFLEKLGPVIDSLPDGVTPHFRDPKVIRWNDKWIMFIGAQREDLKGRLAVYHSDDLHNWEYQGLYGDEFGDYGYMWECPDIFLLDEQYYMIFAPQGIESGSQYHKAPHHNRICKVTITEDGTPTFGTPEPLDIGFEFYAPQSLETPDGRRVVCGWFGLPDEENQPSINNHWVHHLGMMREIKFIDNKLIQRPINELESLFSAPKIIELSADNLNIGTKAYRLKLNLSQGEILKLFNNIEYEFTIKYDHEKNKLIFNRSHTQIREGDEIRTYDVTSESVELEIFADHSSLEIFINGGEAVFSSRVFTPATATNISCVTNNGEAKIAEFTVIESASKCYVNS